MIYFGVKMVKGQGHKSQKNIVGAGLCTLTSASFFLLNVYRLGTAVVFAKRTTAVVFSTGIRLNSLGTQ